METQEKQIYDNVHSTHNQELPSFAYASSTWGETVKITLRQQEKRRRRNRAKTEKRMARRQARKEEKQLLLQANSSQGVSASKLFASSEMPVNANQPRTNYRGSYEGNYEHEGVGQQVPENSSNMTSRGVNDELRIFQGSSVREADMLESLSEEELTVSAKKRIRRKVLQLTKGRYIYQVIITSNRKDGIVTAEEETRLRNYLVTDMKQAMAGCSRRFELRFTYSGLVEPGWFLVTTKDKTSLDWLINDWGMVADGDIIFRASSAPRGPWCKKAGIPSCEKVGFWLESQEVDIPKLKDMLALQNRSLNIPNWHHLETAGGPRAWYVIFLVSREIIKELENADWELYYELDSLMAHRLPTDYSLTTWSSQTYVDIRNRQPKPYSFMTHE